MKELLHSAYFLGIPFAIAAAFHYTDWLGWPALFVGAPIWVGSILILAGIGKGKP